MRTPLCDLLGIEFPVLQAGMGRPQGTPTPPELVAAVSEAGGLGCLGGQGLTPDELREAIHEIRQLTNRPFGVDLLLPVKLEPADEEREAMRARIAREFPEHTKFVDVLHDRYGLPRVRVEIHEVLSRTLIREQVEIVLEERVPVFVAGLGDPSEFVPEAHRRGIKVMGLAGSIRNADRQRGAGVDVVIAQGYEAGGHTGTIANFALIPQVVDAVRPVPVVAAGAIADGHGLVAALALGAVGVWCGTAFLFAHEAYVSEVHREQLAACQSEDLIVSRSYTGKTARVFRNEVVEAWSRSGLDPLPTPLQLVLMDDFVMSAEAANRSDLTNNPAGQVAGMLRERKSAREIVEGMVEEAQEVLAQLQSLTASGT